MASKEYNRAWRAAHPGYFKTWKATHPDYHRKWAEAHPGYNRARYLAWLAKHPNYIRDWTDKNLAKVMWLAARARAKRLGREFSIVLSDVVIPDDRLCPVLGVQMIPRSPYAPTLDRIDNSRGYVPGNVWVICKRANAIKHAAPLEELATVVEVARAREASGLNKLGKPMAGKGPLP